MKNGLAIWHYPHRTMCENIKFFSENGFDAVSLHGCHFAQAVADEAEGEALAEMTAEQNVTITVHHALPDSHSEEDVSIFKKQISDIAEWQQKYGLIHILSFDVSQKIRDNIAPYLDFVLDTVRDVKIAVEDFGLNETERSQIEHLKGNERFGILVDLGHMYIRLRGKNTEGLTLFTNNPDECEATENPSYDEFLKALQSIQFPIFEIHLHNNDGENDLHYFLENGTCDIKMLAKVIKEIGFDGVLTLESAPGYKFECRGSEADAGILATYEYWKECL